MAILTTGIKQYGVNFLGVPYVCTGSPVDTVDTFIYILDSTGGLKSWAKRASFLNNLGGTNKDEIPPYTSFLIIPGATITTDDTKISFGTAIASGGGGSSPLNSNWLM
jgi:hypothetical protein